VSDAELADLLQLCDFGCMPSISNAEMYGLAQVDVMAWGKPVVATRLARSGVPFVNRHEVTGLLVEPGDARALADAINRLAGDPALYRQLAAGAAASFSSEHDCAVVGARYAELIRRVARR
jgi:glycosyltransferase involved in cell wall biosynthesis